MALLEDYHLFHTDIHYGIVSREKEIKEEYLIAQGDSPLFDQIERLRGKFSSHIDEIILVVAKKNPKQEKDFAQFADPVIKGSGVNSLILTPLIIGKSTAAAFHYEFDLFRFSYTIRIHNDCSLKTE